MRHPVRPVRPSTFVRAATRSGLCALLALSAIAGPASAGAVEKSLSVHLSAGEAPGEVVFELRNGGTGSVSVLRSDTLPGGRLEADVLDIRDARATASGGERATYLGRLYKRPPPTPADFVEIAPGESLSAVIDLARYYDVPAAGDYRVDFHGAIEHTHPTSLRPANRTTRHRHAGTPFRAGGPVVFLEPSLFSQRARPPRFNGCSAEQQNVLVTATAAAESITAEALSTLDALAPEDRPSSPRYRRWFGDYSPARYAAVTENYAAVARALSGETVAYDCTCTESAFAYVFPNSPYDVYMCPAFFRAELWGTDSQAGTIVHELSHFAVLAGTRDFRYGQQSAATLAMEDPDRAIANADSHEYFAENTPALPMLASGSGEGSTSSLTLDVARGGTLSIGESAVFSVTGAETIALRSLSGDADLFVFDAPSTDDDSLVCASNGTGVIDVCTVPNARPHYVVVRAYSDSRFEIIARGPEGHASGPPADDATSGPSTNDAPLALATSGGGSGGIGWVWLLLGVPVIARAAGSFVTRSTV